MSCRWSCRRPIETATPFPRTIHVQLRTLARIKQADSRAKHVTGSIRGALSVLPLLPMCRWCTIVPGAPSKRSSSGRGLWRDLWPWARTGVPEYRNRGGGATHRIPDLSRMQGIPSSFKLGTAGTQKGDFLIKRRN